jgi:alkanesulfonate monooxygenase SsuD/methylene tetrahydromethanopterin reductase-like flavin-dependent oxidoreductase (luciferase family)
MVNVLPYRNPLILAEETAMLDVLTNGRLDMGIGRGLKPTEFDAFCLAQSESRPMFEESIEIMLRVWADENFTFNGKYFKINKQTPISPGVVQKPHPPLWVSAQSPESLRWAAERDLMFGQIDALIEDCGRDCQTYRQIQIESGHQPTARLFLTREVYVAETNQQAREEAYEYLLAEWDLWNRYAQFARNGRLPDSYDVWRRRAPVLHALSFDEMIDRGLVLIGSPETVAKKIEEHQQQLDLAVLVCVLQLSHLPHEKVVRSMRLFADEVMPRFKARVRQEAMHV